MGVKEQTFVAGLMEFALCVGDYGNEPHCTLSAGEDSGSGFVSVYAPFLLILSVLFIEL